MIRRILILIMFLSTLVSCDPNRVYDTNKDIPDREWSYDNIVPFEFNIEDTDAKYNIYVNIRHSKSYKFSNIWLIIHTQISDSVLQKRMELPLSNLGGKWYGESMGDIVDHQLQIQENATFPKKGTYKISLEQNMRLDPLPDVLSVGLRVELAVNIEQ